MLAGSPFGDLKAEQMQHCFEMPTPASHLARMVPADVTAGKADLHMMCVKQMRAWCL